MKPRGRCWCVRTSAGLTFIWSRSSSISDNHDMCVHRRLRSAAHPCSLITESPLSTWRSLRKVAQSTVFILLMKPEGRCGGVSTSAGLTFIRSLSSMHSLMPLFLTFLYKTTVTKVAPKPLVTGVCFYMSLKITSLGEPVITDSTHEAHRGIG